MLLLGVDLGGFLAVMQFGALEIAIIRECEFKLDGGAMFGVVPKPLWQKASPSDALNRISLACNLLLISGPFGHVLVDTGMGSRWTAKERERYDLHSSVDHAQVLQSLGLRNDDVNHVVISHLHFDHAGGAVIEKNGVLVPAFPNARYYVQRGEYELARRPNGRARGSYREEDYRALEAAQQLQLIDGDTEIVPGVWTRITGGHTAHHQIITFESEGRKGVYFADIVPTGAHLSPPWVMGYDHFPLDSCDVKEHWLSRCADEGWLVIFDHEIGIPLGYIKREEQSSRFLWCPLSVETLGCGVAAQ